MAIEPMFRVAKIVYFPKLTGATNCLAVIPLGALAEVALQAREGMIKGLALQARTSLRPDELDQVMPQLRQILASPFEYFGSEFELAWREAGPASALEYLATRNCANLSVLRPTDYSERKSLLNLLIPPREEAIEAKLLGAVGREFQDLLKKYPDSIDQQKTVIESGLQAA